MMLYEVLASERNRLALQSFQSGEGGHDLRDLLIRPFHLQGERSEVGERLLEGGDALERGGSSELGYKHL